MPHIESATNSYLRAVREVVPDSESLDDFLDEARLAARDYFGARVKKVSVPTTLAEQLGSTSMKYEGVALAHARVFAIDSLRATLFERRAPASDEINDILTDAHGRFTRRQLRGRRYRHSLSGRKLPAYRQNPLPRLLQDVQTDVGFEEGELPVVASSVVKSISPGVSSGVTEYSLRIDSDTPAATVLMKQRTLIRGELPNIVAGKPLFRAELGFEEEGEALDIPFIMVPNGSAEEHEKFIDAINSRERVEFMLREVQWNLTTR